MTASFPPPRASPRVTPSSRHTMSDVELAGLPGAAQASSEAGGTSPLTNADENAPPVGDDTMAEVDVKATEAAKLKREQLELQKMELDLADRRERHAARAQKIKERELELAERAAKLNGGVGPGGKLNGNVVEDFTNAKNHQLHSAPTPSMKRRPQLQVSSEMGVSIMPSASSASAEGGSEPAPRASTSANGTAGTSMDLVDLEECDASSGELAKKVMQMRRQSTRGKQDMESKLSDLKRQAAESTTDEERRSMAARALAERAVKEARTSRVTELAHLVAVASALFRKSGDLLDHLVSQLVVGPTVL